MSKRKQPVTAHTLQANVGAGLAQAIYFKRGKATQIEDFTLHLSAAGMHFHCQLTPASASALARLLEESSTEVWVHNQAAVEARRQQVKRSWAALRRKLAKAQQNGKLAFDANFDKQKPTA